MFRDEGLGFRDGEAVKCKRRISVGEGQRRTSYSSAVY